MAIKWGELTVGLRGEGAEAALIVVDFINDLEFEDAERLAEPALLAAQASTRLKASVKRAEIPVIIQAAGDHDRGHRV